MATPIAIAAIGGLYAEKSGVFNIGLEGFMIIGAFSAAAMMFILGLVVLTAWGKTRMPSKVGESYDTEE